MFRVCRRGDGLVSAYSPVEIALTRTLGLVSVSTNVELLSLCISNSSFRFFPFTLRQIKATVKIMIQSTMTNTAPAEAKAIYKADGEFCPTTLVVAGIMIFDVDTTGPAVVFVMFVVEMGAADVVD